MYVVDAKTKKIHTQGGSLIQGMEMLIWSDTTPASLDITGDDVGYANAEILPGSVLITPSKRYVMGEAGSFTEITW